MDDRSTLGYEATCKRKVPYSSQAIAERAIVRMQDMKRGDQTLAAYRCIVCANWHIGHVPVTPLDRLPRLASYEFIGVRHDGTLARCTSFVNCNAHIVVFGQASRKELKGWIEPRWFAPDTSSD
jgi:hypothetical protein